MADLGGKASRQLRSIHDRAEMQRAIEELDPERDLAILCVHCGPADAPTSAYMCLPLGEAAYIRCLGLLEAAKMAIAAFHHAQEDDDESTTAE